MEEKIYPAERYLRLIVDALRNIWKSEMEVGWKK
jgi:hypothetical protein